MSIDIVKKLLVGILLLSLIFRFRELENKTSNYINGQFVTFHTTLFTEPKIAGNYQIFSAKDQHNSQITIKTPLSPQYHYGQILQISGTISIKMRQNTSTQRSEVPNNKKIVPTMYFPKIEAEKNKENPPIELGLALLSTLRQSITSLFNKIFPEPFSSLMLGIVFGISGQMPQNFLNSLRISGVMHVIAASGMNVTLVSGFLFSIFAFFLRRQMAIVFSILGILFYAALAGFAPSIVRASIMGISGFSAQMFGRQNLALYNLGIAGYLMLFISPDLITDVGFQLSFLSTLGLILFRPVFNKSIFTDEVATTICAQIATLPVLLANFGTYSLWSVAVNGLVLWTVPYLMVLGGLCAFFGLLSEVAGRLISFLALPFLFYFQFIVIFFAKLPQIITISEISWEFIAGYYLLISSIFLFLWQKQKTE